MTVNFASVHSRSVNFRDPLARYTPRNTSYQSARRFYRERLTEYFRRVGGSPNEHEAQLIDQMINEEWQALRLEGEAGETEDEKKRYGRLRQALDYRRLLMLHDRELTTATNRKLPMSVRRNKPGPPQLSLEEHLALVRRAGADGS